MQKINDEGIKYSSANTKFKMERALNPALFSMGNELKVSVMTNRKENFSGKNDLTTNGQLSEAERFDRSFRNSESEYESIDTDFHWMADASYNFSKTAPKLLNKNTNNEK
jgi:hypothetical protein